MKNKYLKVLVRLAKLVGGCAMTAAVFGWIVIPQGFAAGGITGLAIPISKIVPIPISLIVLIGNLILLILGWLIVGKAFIAKTLLLTWLFPIMLEFFQRQDYLSALAVDPLLSVVIGGVFLGVGSALILLGDGSSGGFDTLGVILNQTMHVPISLVMYLCNFTVILLQAASGTLLQTVYGVLVSLISSITLNQVLTRGQRAGQIWIFSEKWEPISQKLLHELDLGLSFFLIESGYRHQNGKAILTIVPVPMIESVKQCVYRADPTAFIVVDSIRYVGGRGYTISR